MTTLHDAIDRFLASISNPRTARAYGDALARFEAVAPADLAHVDETQLVPFAQSMSDKAEATRQLCLQAVVSFFAYVVMLKMSEAVSLDRARLIKRKLRGKHSRISNYPRQELETFIEYARNLHYTRGRTGLLALRDRALILTMAETGLRRSEAASLKLSDVDLEAGQAVVIGKGDKQAVVYFGETSLAAVREYIGKRWDKSPASPLFMRHDKGAGPVANHVDGSAINYAIQQRAREAIGEDNHIHPHALRHYFITTVYEQTGDLKLAKELARHESIATTDRYTHIADGALRSAHARIFSRKD